MKNSPKFSMWFKLTIIALFILFGLFQLTVFVYSKYVNYLHRPYTDTVKLSDGFYFRYADAYAPWPVGMSQEFSIVTKRSKDSTLKGEFVISKKEFEQWFIELEKVTNNIKSDFNAKGKLYIFQPLKNDRTRLIYLDDAQTTLVFKRLKKLSVSEHKDIYDYILMLEKVINRPNQYKRGGNKGIVLHMNGIYGKG